MLLVCCRFVDGFLMCYWCVVGMLVGCWWVIGVTRNMQNGLWAISVFKMVSRTCCGFFSVSNCP